MTILLGDFSAKVGKNDIFKWTIGNESLQKISNNNVVKVVNFATCKNLTGKNAMFPQHNISRRRHSSVLDVQSFRAVDCDIDHHMAAEVRERQEDHINFIWRDSVLRS
jgi:hypothetical protein